MKRIFARVGRLVGKVWFFGRLKMRTKLLLIIGVVLSGYSVMLVAGSVLVEEVRVGGRLYDAIRTNKDALETIALLKSDLNQARAEMAVLATETNRDRIDSIEERVQVLQEDVETRFESLLQQMPAEDKQIYLQDARGTWREFLTTFDSELVPMVKAGKVAGARGLSTGIQTMRYRRFIEQVDTVVMVLELEVEELEEKTAATARRKMVVNLVVGAALFLVVMLSLVLFGRSITGRLAALKEHALRIAAGDLSDEGFSGAGKYLGARDEVGDLFRAFNEMRGGLRSLYDRVAAAFGELERGVTAVAALSGKIEEGSRRQSEALGRVDGLISGMNEISRETNQSMANLSEMSENVSSSTEEMMVSIQQVAASVQSLFSSVDSTSSSTEEMIASITEVAGHVSSLSELVERTTSSMNQIGTSVREVESSARRAREFAEEVKRRAREEGGEALKEITSAMDGIRTAVLSISGKTESLGKSVGSIGEILEVIVEVAEQTNLLALNAAIIAAQAGEHGRGFSVVAEEIRELAERTSSSTKEIAGVVNGIRKETREMEAIVKEGVGSVEVGVVAVNRTDAALNTIVESADQAAEMGAGIARSTSEQAEGAGEVMRSTEEVADRSRRISLATTEQSDNSRGVSKAIAGMREQAEQVRRAAEEQSRAAELIATSGEKTAKLAKDVSRMAQTGSEHSDKVLAEVGTVGETIASAVEVSTQLKEMVEKFAALAGTLGETLKLFRT